jgi:hypothetical protein
VSGVVVETIHYFDTYDNALAFIDRVKKTPNGVGLTILYLSIHKTYFDETGILLPVYESVYLWENHNDN